MRSKRSRSTAITFEVASFEYIRTGESDVLLRLEGSWLSSRDRGVPGIELTLTRGERSIVLDPLPDPSNFPVAATPSGMPWRAAFPASLEVTSDPSARFVLSLSDGTDFHLDTPPDRDAKHEPVLTLVEDREPEAEPERVRKPIAALPEADRIKAIIAESIERFAVLEERIERERAGRADAERRLAAAEEERADAIAAVSGSAQVRGHLEEAAEQAEAAQVQAGAARDEALANVASLESQLEATTSELEQLRADAVERGAGFEAQVEELRAELGEARADAEKLQTVLEVANAARHASDEQLSERTSAEEALREQLAERERDLAAAQAEATVTAARLAESEQALAAAGEASARVAELESELGLARQEAQDRGDALEAKSADVKELTAWSAELESRLAKAEAGVADAGDSDRLMSRVSELEAVLAEAEKIAEDRLGAEVGLRHAEREGEEFARRAREAEEAAAESAAALDAAVAERGQVEARLNQLEVELAEATQLAGAESMARDEMQRQLESGHGSADDVLKGELEKAREAAVRERGQRASFEQELKRREDVEFELRNSVEALEAEVESLRGELAGRDERVTDWQRRVEDTRIALEAAEAATAEARIARSNIERDLRELSESGDDDAETAMARHKTQLADLRRELEEAVARETQANRRIEELERGLTEAGDDAHKQQVLGELDRLKAAAGQATEKFQEEARRRQKLEEELESRVVAEERLRAMLQAKVAPARTADPSDDAPVQAVIPAEAVDETAATSQGDFLERLAAAKTQAASVER